MVMGSVSISPPKSVAKMTTSDYKHRQRPLKTADFDKIHTRNGTICHHNDGKTTTAIEHTVPDAGRFPTERAGRKPGRKPGKPGRKPGSSLESPLCWKHQANLSVFKCI